MICLSLLLRNLSGQWPYSKARSEFTRKRKRAKEESANDEDTRREWNGMGTGELRKIRHVMSIHEGKGLTGTPKKIFQTKSKTGPSRVSWACSVGACTRVLRRGVRAAESSWWVCWQWRRYLCTAGCSQGPEVREPTPLR